MSTGTMILVLVCCLLLGYLTFALLHPERF